MSVNEHVNSAPESTKPAPQTKRAKPLSQFCADWSMGRTKAYELINAGKLRAVLNVGRRVVLAEDEEAYAASLNP